VNSTDTNWSLLRSGPGDPAFNMAVDAALLETAPERSVPVLRFYAWTQPAATFGYFHKYAEVEQFTHLRPLVRRPTGGGVVPHDADWTYSVAFPPTASWHNLKAIESYRRIHEWVAAAFQKLGVPAELAPESRKALLGQCFVGHEQFDVLWRGKKIAGAAQRRTRNGLLIQGSVQPPSINLPRAMWEQAMLDVATARAAISWTNLEWSDTLKHRTEELAAKTYAAEAYNRRR
jgi:lipoate-protein ligase A